LITEPGHVIGRGEPRPGQRVLLLQRLDAVAHGAAVVVQVEEDPVVLGGRRVLRQGPATGDVGAQGIEARDEAELPVALEAQAGGERQVAAPTLAGDDDAAGVD
jgi:hypothetical protein